MARPEIADPRHPDGWEHFLASLVDCIDRGWERRLAPKCARRTQVPYCEDVKRRREGLMTEIQCRCENRSD
jgi:hypothetical protein